MGRPQRRDFLVHYDGDGFGVVSSVWSSLRQPFLGMSGRIWFKLVRAGLNVLS